ncbi:MAG: surface lipoprotein assembly modifier [Paracoccaceae bacterium]
MKKKTTRDLIFPFYFVVASLFAAPVFADETQDCAQPLREIILHRDFGLAYYCSGLRLEANANDAEAQLVFARAAQELGQWDIAADFARRARQNPLANSERFASYLISGMAEAGQGNTLKARIMLRRGSDYADNPDEKRIISQAMAQVRARAPWQFGLSFNVNPSNNVNAGSLHSIHFINGLPFNLDADAQAQTGIGFSLFTNASYRRQISAHMLWETTFRLNGTAYEGRGRNDINLGVKTSLQYVPQCPSPVQWLGYFGFDRRYISKELGGPAFDDYRPYTTQFSVGIERHWQPGPQENWSGYASYSLRKSDDNGTSDAEIWRLGGSYGFPIFDNTAMFIGGYLEDTVSPDVLIGARAGNVSIGLTWHLQELPLSLSGNVYYTGVRYKSRSSVDSLVRRDDVVSLEITATPRELQWFGFNPTFGVAFTRGFSNLNRFDTRELRVFTRVSSVF